MRVEAMKDLATSAGLVGLLLAGALFLLVVTFVALCVASLRKDSDKQHLLALLGRITELAAALRSGTAPVSHPATPAPTALDGVRANPDDSGDNR
jgi:hypothetical protein